MNPPHLPKPPKPPRAPKPPKPLKGEPGEEDDSKRRVEDAVSKVIAKHAKKLDSILNALEAILAEDATEEVVTAKGEVIKRRVPAASRAQAAKAWKELVISKVVPDKRPAAQKAKATQKYDPSAIILQIAQKKAEEKKQDSVDVSAN